MNVLFVTAAAPGKTPFSTTEKRMPLGLGILCSVVRNAGHRVFFEDTYLRSSAFPDPLYLKENKIHAVGVYVNTICFRDAVRIFCELESLRRSGRWSGKILCGGPHVSVAPETIPEFVDHLVMGEGEEVILDILDGRADREIQAPRIKDLDALPSPAWDIFENLPYDKSVPWIKESPVFTLNTSRGCPFKCAFCSVGSIWGKTYRAQSAERIMEEIDFLVKRYNAQGIYFREDNFTLNWKRVNQFCDLLRKRPYKIKWMCESRVDSLNPEKLEIMKASGLSALFLGLESGTQRMLDFYNKGITLDQTRQAAQACREAGVFMAGSFVVGGPTESVAEIQQTIDFANSLQLSTCWLNVFVGIPKSKMWRYAIDHNLVEYTDDRGLVYLKGHNEMADCFYNGDPATRIPNQPGEDGWIEKYKQALEEQAPLPKKKASKPRVSVLMSVHNSEQHVKAAINSILAQTMGDFELNVLNDGSTDNTAEIISSIEDPRITLVNLPHMGLTKALNVGVQLCRGEYIARMDGDDISHPTRFEAQVKLLDHDPRLGVVGAAFNMIDDLGNTLQEVEVLTDPDAIRRGLLLQNWFCHSSTMFRLSAALQVSPGLEGIWNEDFPYAQDYELWLRMSEKFHMANIPRVLHQWRRSEKGVSLMKNQEQLECSNRARAQALCRLKQTQFAPTLINPSSRPGPAISIIMPTYKRDHLIKESIKSVLSQTWTDFELLVVDDGGSGASQVAAESFKDPRIKYQWVEHGGLSSTLNRGLRMAQGEYVGFLDDDDIFYPNHLETLITALDKGPHQVVYSDAVRAIQRSYEKSYKVVERSPAWRVEFSKDLYLLTNYTPILSVALQRELIQASGGFDEELEVLMDWDFWIRLSQITDFKRIPVETCEFRVREDGSNMTSERAKSFQNCRAVINRKYRHLIHPLLSGIPFAEEEEKIISMAPV